MVRKWFRHDHIPQRFAPEVNRFAQGTLSPFLNFHRPCLFATEYRDGNGRTRRKYLAGDVMPPHDRLRSLPDAGRFLKPGIDFALLDAVAAETDLEAARRVQAERRALFRRIGGALNRCQERQHQLLRRQNRSRLARIERQIKALNAEIQRLVGADAELSR